MCVGFKKWLLEYDDPDHVLDSDRQLQAIADKMDLLARRPLKSIHIHRMLELLRKHPDMSPDDALQTAIDEN